MKSFQPRGGITHRMPERRHAPGEVALVERPLVGHTRSTGRWARRSPWSRELPQEGDVLVRKAGDRPPFRMGIPERRQPDREVHDGTQSDPMHAERLRPWEPWLQFINEVQTDLNYRFMQALFFASGLQTTCSTERPSTGTRACSSQ